MKKLFLCLIMIMASAPLIAQSMPVCDARAHGAKGDGVSIDTIAVSNAIATCVKDGGGTVYFAPGRYVIGTVQLFSHIRLYLAAGSALVGSRDIHDYLPSPPFGFARNYGIDITGEGTLLGMLIAKNAEDVSIEGEGEIDGQGDTFMAPTIAHESHDYMEQYVRNPAGFREAMNSLQYGPIEPGGRPGTMIVFFHCSNVRVHGVTLHAAPNWTLHLQDVEGAAISDIQILNNPNIPNNDGIDCMMCRRVRVSNCTIDTGDDGFAIVRSENVNVSDCSISSRSAAIRLESTKLSTFTGLSMDTNRGIAIFGDEFPGQESRSTEALTFSDIVIRTHLIPGGWWGKAEPIYIAVQPCEPGVLCGIRVRNIKFNNIIADAENGVLLWGGDGTPISEVEFNGVRLHIHAPNEAMSNGVGGNLDLRWTAADARDGIVKSDIPAIYAKKVDRLLLRNVQVDWDNSLPEYFSEAVRTEDFNDLTIDDLVARQAQMSSGEVIHLENGSGVSITNSRAIQGTRTFLGLHKVDGRRVFVNYDLGGAAHAIEPTGLRFDTQIGPSVAKRVPLRRTGVQTAKHHPPD